MNYYFTVDDLELMRDLLAHVLEVAVWDPGSDRKEHEDLYQRVKAYLRPVCVPE